MKYTGIDRQPVDYNQISPSMLVAIVAIETTASAARGARHQGHAVAARQRPAAQPIRAAPRFRAAYVKNVLILQALDDKAAQQAAAADTMSRKIDQLRMAVQGRARQMSKEQILAGINDSYYGSGAWGIEARRRRTFNTTAAKLTC